MFFREGLMSSFPIGVPAYILPEEIEARSHVRNDGFSPERVQAPVSRRKFTTSSLISSSSFSRSACDNKVIRVTNEVYAKATGF